MQWDRNAITVITLIFNLDFKPFVAIETNYGVDVLHNLPEVP